MKQSSKRLVSLGIALLLVVGALLIFFDVIQPEYGNLTTLKGQISGEQTLLATEKQAVGQAQQVIASYHNQSQGAQNLSLTLPSYPDIAGGLAQIYGIAQSDDVAIQSIGITVPTLTQAQAAPAAAGIGQFSSPSSIVKPVGNFSFQIVGVGSYEALQSLLTGIETNIRIFDLKSITVAPVQAVVSTPATKTAAAVAPVVQDFFTYTINLTTYYQAP